jgi:hypothetical protein
MVRQEDVDACWRAVLESHRVDEEAFDGEISGPLALALMMSAEPNVRSAQHMLLNLRHWYGPLVERSAVLAVMKHWKEPRSPEVRRLARALWDNHQVCAGPVECSLHSLGSLCAFNWLGAEDAQDPWLTKALEVLVSERPLRGWSVHLPRRCADWLGRGWMTAASAERLITLSVEAGLHERLSNSDTLAEFGRGLSCDWATSLSPAATPASSTPSLGATVSGSPITSGTGPGIKP